MNINTACHEAATVPALSVHLMRGKAFPALYPIS